MFTSLVAAKRPWGGGGGVSSISLSENYREEGKRSLRYVLSNADLKEAPIAEPTDSILVSSHSHVDGLSSRHCPPPGPFGSLLSYLPQASNYLACFTSNEYEQSFYHLSKPLSGLPIGLDRARSSDQGIKITIPFL